jgi:ABC-type transport system involved in multi-copper enzyme maturation permease subunit
LPGILTITKKEFMDHVSDQTFLLCFGTLLIVMVASTFYQLDYIHQQWVSLVPNVGFIESELWKANQSSEMLQTVLTENISSLGALVAIALSFNSINKERTEGSLKVLLSYPISKAKIILGKLLGGILVIIIVVLTSFAISLSIEMYSLSIPLSGEVALRLATIIGLGIVLLVFFLCLGTAMSIVVRDPSTCLISLLVISTLLQVNTIAMILVTIGNIFPRSLTINGGRAGLQYSPSTYSWQRPTVLTLIDKNWLRISPVLAYRTVSDNIFHFQNVFTTGVVEIVPIEFWWLLPRNINLMYTPVIYMVVAFLACIVLFQWRDID